MKVYLNQPNESWIVDRFRDEWYSYNKDLITNNPKDADIIWIIAPWMWKKIPKKYLKQKIVLCTIHHIDFSKFDDKEKANFQDRDLFVDYYHTVSEKTKKQISNLTNKHISAIPFWINQNIFFNIKEKEKIRKNYKINKDAYLIGSFQRDTEGSDLKSPKLSKGPDQFLEIVKRFHDKNKNTTVVLTGKRRKYLIDNLYKIGIPFYYFEMITFSQLNELYNCLDLYVVASRVEGGPQAIVECGITKTPIISTDVGLASQILHKSSIFNMENFEDAKPDILTAYNNSLKLIIPNRFKEFRTLLEKIK